jgi:DNA-binding NtrC family response regulator
LFTLMAKSPADLRWLVVEDDPDFRQSLVQWLTRRGHHASAAASGAEALTFAESTHFNLAIFDLRMPGLSGLDLLTEWRKISPETQIMILTGEGTIATAVEAMKRGAHDYLLKPVSLQELERKCLQALEVGVLRAENERLRQALTRSRPPCDIIGQSPVMQDLFRLIEKAGPTDQPVLIQGESGTGKELVARALHRASRRADQPLVVVNCAALPEALLESELFGHEKGAFTGAIAAKPGLFELADGGTLFIDEIGELALTLQAKLLRALQEGSFRRVGSLQERRVSVRILAATNRRLDAEVSAHRFREDLFYRINVLCVEVPPLRQRNEDLALLIRHFLGDGWEIEHAALDAMHRYPWPGNVRQLANAIERAKILADECCVRLRDLAPEIRNTRYEAAPTSNSSVVNPNNGSPDTSTLSDRERDHIVDVLRREKGNKSRAARSLGVTRRTLYRLLERHGLVETGGAE